MSLYASCLRPLLFRTDPEAIHDRAIATAERISGSALLCSAVRELFSFEDDPRLARNVAGMDFRHPIGLAAGFDKS